MLIESIKIAGFRCIGPTATTVVFDPVTGLVGSNGSGKSAVLQALARLFGLASGERTVVPSDFCVSRGTQIDDEAESLQTRRCEWSLRTLTQGTKFTTSSFTAGEIRLYAGSPRTLFFLNQGFCQFCDHSVFLGQLGP